MSYEPELNFFDLDGTIYPIHNRIWKQMSINIETYIADHLQIPFEEAVPLRNRLYETYGTTLKGLQAEFNVDGMHYLSHVHDFEITQFVSPNRKLQTMLSNLPGRKWIFTNSDRPHAQRVLEALGIAEYFEGIVDILATNFIPKPNRKAYVAALELANAVETENITFFEDSIRNLTAAKELGWQTVWISDHARHPDADHQINRLEEFKLPQRKVAHGR
jgi:putative hydrolase of the HAD superfamily